MKTLDIKIDTSSNEAKNFRDVLYKTQTSRRVGKELSVVNGDVALLAMHFQEQDLAGDIQDMDLTGALALRVSLLEARTTGATVLSFQDVFNQGDLLVNEDLSTGKVTWQLDHPAATLDAVLGVNESVSLWYEFTWLSPSNLPQTLGQVPVKLYAQGDIGAVGSPPPSEPTYMTAATALATFVRLLNYLVPTTISGGPTTLTSIAGLQVNKVDTTGGPETINLPESSVSDADYAPEIINVGTGVVTVVPDATGTPDTINGIAGSQTINTQYGSLRLFNDPSNNNWIAPISVTPS
jgi:hypothetical protein